MIYLDNAATTWPKPESVYRALDEFARRRAANPGRSGHRMARAAEEAVESARARVAGLLNAESPTRIALTLNATDAITIALRGLALKEGDHVVTSVLEHNTINRWCTELARRGVRITKVDAELDATLSPDAVRRALTPATKLLALTHASNALGSVNDAGAFGEIARGHGALLLLDASQTAGVVPIDVRAMRVDLAAFPGHKGCFGPMGTGALYVREGIDLEPLRRGGTGHRAESEEHPAEMPFRLEAGTPNAHGLAGLAAGLEFVAQTGVAAIGAHERALALRFAEGVRRHPKVTVHAVKTEERQIGPVSISIRGTDPADAGRILDERHGIACRPGLHCAPGAHRFAGTFPKGTVRFSFGYFNTTADADAASAAVLELAGA